MLTLYSLYVALLFVTTISGIALAVYAWKRRETPGAMAFVGLMLSTALSSFSLAMLAFTNSPEAADFWGRRVRFIANATAPVLLLIFAIQYTGRGKWLSLPRLALLFAIPLISLILTWSGEAHYLFLHFSMAKTGPFTFLGRTTTTGSWNVVHLTYSYLAILLSLGLLLLQVFRAKFPYRGQVILLFVGSLAPFLANVPDSFMMDGPRPSFTPLGFAVLGLIYAWALFRYRLFQIVPVARDLVIESMADAVLVLDEQHRLVDVNPAAQTLMGRTASELIGQPIEQVLPAWSELAEGQDSRLRAEIVLGEGERAQHIALSEQPIRDRAEHLVGYLVILRDISERKRREETTRWLLLLLETLDAGCFVKDRDGIYQYINRAFERQFGVKREDLIGQDDAYVFGEETAQLMRENDRRIMASRETESVEESGYLQGKGYVVYMTIKTPIIDENGHVSGICGVGMDITHQKQIEKELRESEEKYRDLVERISDVIYTIDTMGELTYISPAIEGLLGYLPSEIIGQPFSMFVTPEDLHEMRANFQRLSSGIGPGPNVYRLLTKAGEVRWVRVSSEPIANGDQVFGVRGVLTDITDRVRAEAQREGAAADAERARLARDLHDAVTQTLYSVALTAEALPRVWERHPDEAQAALKNLHRLSRGALAEMRALLLELRPAILREKGLSELLRQLAHAAMGRTQLVVETKVEGEHSLPEEVHVALYRIAQEALNNVVKHAEARQATMYLDFGPEQVALCIHDDGRGFAPESVPGHGFGLQNMADRAKGIGAEFSLQSQPGEGTWIEIVWRNRSSEPDADKP